MYLSYHTAQAAGKLQETLGTCTCTSNYHPLKQAVLLFCGHVSSNNLCLEL